MNQVAPDARMAALREPFPPELIDKLPKGGTTLDYVGHAAVTDRLLKVDPTWNWEPLAYTDEGLPLFTRAANGNPIGLWIKLTIAGVTRLGYGSVAPGAFDAEKQLIGDALRNAAMRFGVALDLWSKSDLYFEDSHHSAPPAAAKGKPSPKASAPQETLGDATAPVPTLGEAVTEAARNPIGNPPPPRHVRPDWMKKAALKAQEAGLRLKDIPALKLHESATSTDVENALVAWRIAISEDQPKAGDVWVLEQFDQAIEEAKKVPEGVPA